MRELSHEFSWVRVTWYITDPKISFKNKKRQILYVNKRVISSPMIAKAVYDAYNRFIPHGTQPGYILSIDIDPTQVDVNVHPRKMEVRFAGEATIFRSVYHGIKDELERVSLVQDFNTTPSSQPSPLGEKEQVANSFNLQPLSPPKERGFRSEGNKYPEYYTGSGTKFKSYSPYKNTQSNPAQAWLDFSREILRWSTWAQDSENFKNNTSPESQVWDLRETPLWRIVWQVHNSYIVLQTAGGMLILDQHALAERVIYEKLASSSYTPKIQWLLWWWFQVFQILCQGKILKLLFKKYSLIFPKSDLCDSKKFVIKYGLIQPVDQQ